MQNDSKGFYMYKNIKDFIIRNKFLSLVYLFFLFVSLIFLDDSILKHSLFEKTIKDNFGGFGIYILVNFILVLSSIISIIFSSAVLGIMKYKNFKFYFKRLKSFKTWVKLLVVNLFLYTFLYLIFYIVTTIIFSLTSMGLSYEDVKYTLSSTTSLVFIIFQGLLFSFVNLIIINFDFKVSNSLELSIVLSKRSFRYILGLLILPVLVSFIEIFYKSLFIEHGVLILGVIFLTSSTLNLIYGIGVVSIFNNLTLDKDDIIEELI